jgi:parvulin-like peptidyl-prolyl isomerase
LRVLRPHFGILTAGLLLSSATLAQGVPATPAHAAPAETVFATVNGKTITRQDFNVAFSNHLRQTYYHAQVPPEKLPEARKEVTERLIDRALLLEEARRRGLTADATTVNKTLADYEARYAGSPLWQKDRERLLPGLKTQLEEQSLFEQIEKIGRTTAEPTDEAVRAFYTARPELFTEPEKLRLHSILLKVEASSPGALWQAAREEAERLVKKIRAGESTFEDLARVHSHDDSGERGGDMGYLHTGMVPPHLQEKIDAQPLGTVTDPIEILEGVAIFRLDDRLDAKLMPYETVATRARELLKREDTAKAWQNFLAGLRNVAVIQLTEPVHVPAITAPAATAPAAAAPAKTAPAAAKKN